MSDGSYSYAYNAESEMKTAAGVSYTYDGLGNRVKKSTGTLYWYGPGGEVLDETDLAGNATNEYVFFGGKRIARRDASSNVYDYFVDELGSARIIVNPSGVICYSADFYPFGGERTTTNTCPQNYKFTGKERDSETGNDDFGARYYSSSFGRFLSADWSATPDPVPYAHLTDPKTLNLYGYVRENPEAKLDADGHCPECIAAALGAGAGFFGDIIAQKIRNPHGHINWKEAGAAALGGAITGATLGLVAPAEITTLGGTVALQTGSQTALNAAAGTAGGALGGVAERTVETGSLGKAVENPTEIAEDAATGGLGATLGRATEEALDTSVKSTLGATVLKRLSDLGQDVAARLLPSGVAPPPPPPPPSFPPRVEGPTMPNGNDHPTNVGTPP